MRKKTFMNFKQDEKILAKKAVAIATDPGGDAADAPILSAKGRGYRAEKILDYAFAEGIKVRQDTELVELLDTFEVESPVPLEALHAVSLILERVYMENQKLSSHKEEPTA